MIKITRRIDKMISDTFKLNIDGKEKEILVRSPALQDQRESQKVYNQAFSDAVKSGSIVRAKLDDLLKDQGLWDDNKQAKFTSIQKEILDGEKTLSKGGISLKQARSIAVRMKGLREQMRDLIAVRTNLDTHTAEGQADNARFNYLVSTCLVYNDTKKPYFSNYEDYLNRSGDVVAIIGAQKLANMLYGLDSDFEKKLPENKFLAKYKFINDNLQYINKDGKLTDEEGRFIDENGRFINDAGEFVDKDGNLVDASGEYVSNFSPFLDEDGKPVDEDTHKEKQGDVESVTQSSAIVSKATPETPEESVASTEKSKTVLQS
jgi:hypothetical protein